MKTRAIAHVQVVMMKVTGRGEQAVAVPGRIAFLTEKIGPHVVIDPNNHLGSRIEERHQLRSDQAAGSRHENFHDIVPVPSWPASVNFREDE